MTWLESTNALESLAQLQAIYPHWRLGQLVCNVAGWADVNPWDLEDDQLIAAVRAHLSHLEAGASSLTEALSTSA